MLDDDSGNPTGTDPGARRQGTEGDAAFTVVIDATSDDGSDGVRGERGLINVGLESNDDPDSIGRDSFSVDFGNNFGDDEDDELPAGDTGEHELSFRATSEDYGEPDVDLSPWAPLLGMLDSTESEASPDDRSFTPTEGAHALELRAESMLLYAERGAQRTGELDRTEVGVSDDNRDVVAGRDDVEIDGMLEEHTGHGLVHVADDVEMNVGGRLRMHAHLEDNIIMAGVMRDEFAGGTFVTAAMSDDMAAGLGLRCTAPLDVWVHGLVGMEERPGTCAADGVLFELAGTLYEREYGPSAHVALVARQQSTVVTTMKTGFRPLMKTALGVRNLIPGGGGGGGQASASPPAAPPAPGGGEAGAATLTAAESGGALGRGAAGSDDTDEIVSVVRTVESASDAAEVEELQHPASTADNLDDLARVEGEGYQQVAEIYEQPIPASAASGTGADPAGAAAAPSRASSRRPPPPLDRTEPGAEGYDFGKAYGSLRERNHYYRLELNLRGNMFMRNALDEIDKSAIALFENLGGSLDDVTGDYRGRTVGIVEALENMAEQADAAGDSQRVADLRNAIDEIEGMVHHSVVEFATRTDEFSGAALGSQRAPIDSNIDTAELRGWLEKQMGYAEAKFGAAVEAGDQHGWELASKERDYFDQMIKSLNAGQNPLNESGEQIVFLRKKVQDYYAKYAGDVAAAAEEGYVLVPPRPLEEDHLELFLEQHDRLVATLSDPDFFLGAEDMGLDAFTPPVRARIEADDAFLGPDSLRSRTRPPPKSLDLTAPGAEGYDFRSAYDSLYTRNQYYREEFLFQGNYATRGHLRDIDAKAFELFEGFGGSADEIVENSFGYHTPGTYDALEKMAANAEAAGDMQRAGEIRAAMDEIAEFLNGRLAEVASRTDEFSGAPVEPGIDKVRLRGWMQGELEKTIAKFDAAANDGAAQRLAGFERGYWERLISSLDNRANPLAYSNEQIDVIRKNKIDPYYAKFADEAATATAEGYEFIIPRPPAEDELDVYLKLQNLLAATLSDPEFRRSAEVTGTDAFAAAARSRVGTGLDLLQPDTLRPVAGADLPPLPAANPAADVGYIDEVRNRSFSRSALTASEETLQRQAAGLAEGGASVRSRAPAPGAGVPEPSLGNRRAPPDNAQTPHVDERTGRWVVDRTAQPNASPVSADGPSPHMRGGGTTSQTSDVSWESGLQASGDSEVGTEAGLGAGSADDTDTSNLFKAPSEPVDEVRHATHANDDGVSGSPGTGADGTGDEDANPTGIVSGPDDFTATLRPGDGTGPGPSGTTSSITRGTPDPVSTGTPRNAPGTDATPGGAAAPDAGEGAAGTRSDLYSEPVSFEGRSLEGAPLSDDPKELARSLDGAEVPVEDLPPVEPDAAEPARKSILKNSDGRPVSDDYRDVHDQIIDLRREWAKENMVRFNRGTGNADSVWRRGRDRTVALREANARWSQFAAAQRTSSTSFSDDPRQLLYAIEHEATVYKKRRGRFVDLYRGAEPPNTIDRSHAAHYIPRPRGWERAHETGFGRLSQGWNQFPFSHPRADPEHAVEGRVPEPRPDRRARVGPRGLPCGRRRALLVPVPRHGGHDLGSGRPVPAHPMAHAGLARPAPPPAHRDAGLRRRGGLSASSRDSRRCPYSKTERLLESIGCGCRRQDSSHRGFGGCDPRRGRCGFGGDSTICDDGSGA